MAEIGAKVTVTVWLEPAAMAPESQLRVYAEFGRVIEETVSVVLPVFVIVMVPVELETDGSEAVLRFGMVAAAAVEDKEEEDGECGERDGPG